MSFVFQNVAFADGGFLDGEFRGDPNYVDIYGNEYIPFSYFYIITYGGDTSNNLLKNIIIFIY